MGQLCSICVKVFCWPPWTCCTPGKLVARVSLVPPEPSYAVEDGPDGKTRVVQKDADNGLVLRNTELSFVETRRGSRIACAFISCVPVRDRAILVSHGNGEDLGTELGALFHLGRAVGWNVMVYDYSGYGQSSGEPLEANLYADVEAALELLGKRYEVPPERVVLMGRSIGSVPSIALAGKEAVAGLVLLCPLASGLRTLFPGLRASFPCDPYRNIERIAAVRCPVLVVHGTADTLVAPSQGRALLEACPTAVSPLWVEGAGHNDLHFELFLPRLRQFLAKEITRKPRSSLAQPQDLISQ